MKHNNINIIVAMTPQGLIGLDGKLPWYIPADMENFRRLTTGDGNNSVIMGRNTYNSLGEPLRNRKNIVVSKSLYGMDFQSDNKCENKYLGIVVKPSLENAITYARSSSDDIFLIGGRKIFEEGIPLADKMYITIIKDRYVGNIYFPEFDISGWDVQRMSTHKLFDVWLYSRID